MNERADAVRSFGGRNQDRERGYEASKERRELTDARKEKNKERVRIDVSAARCRWEESDGSEEVKSRFSP